MLEPSRNHSIQISQGMSGYYAVHVAEFQHSSGAWYWDCIQTGIGRYKTREEAEKEAKSWAESEGLPYKE